MGLCGSSDDLSPEERDQRRADRAASRKLDQEMARAHQDEVHISKLLLLGAGESGKSTLFKQMLLIYKNEGKEPNAEERANVTPIIYNNILTSMKTLCQMSETYGQVQSAEAQQAKDTIEGLKGDVEINDAVGADLQTLWNDPGIRATYDMRSHYQLTDSAAYFFDRLDVIASGDYCPSGQDVLRSRVRTTGIVEQDFTIEGNRFKMFDVGGQRNERKKWIHCFAEVTAVLFVAAISEYDQVLYEDENTNRMVEALNLFDEICNSRWFRETAMILFLNKKDLFEEKITRVPLNTCFEEYTGPNEYGPALDFIQHEFQSRNRSDDKEIYAHASCATDTDTTRKIFDSVRDVIIKLSLKQAGLG